MSESEHVRICLPTDVATHSEHRKFFYLIDLIGATIVPFIHCNNIHLKKVPFLEYEQRNFAKYIAYINVYFSNICG